MHRNFVAVGAWTTIAVVGFDPFVQQLVNYRTELVFGETSAAKVAMAQRWSGAECLGSSKSLCITICT